MSRKTFLAVAGSLALVLTAGSVFGQGMLVPKDTALPPLAIKSQQVTIAIDNQVATTTVKQVFVNSTSRQLEANYVFPLPPDSTIRDFAMMVDGKRTSGELVEAKQARQIYQQIVSQARDPGLLEHLGDNLFRVNIFPVPANGTQTVELSFSQVVPGSAGLFRYTYPLKTGSKASQVQEDFSIGLTLKSKVPIKSVYSPSHQIGLNKKGDHEATVGLELTRAVLDTDFSLYWTVSEKDFGLNAVSYRPDPAADGYLMLLLSPKSSINADEVIAKDVQFVFDVSGSMSGAKLEQAKKALRQCVGSLNPKDRFNIVTFSTDVTPYKDGLIDATKENKEEANDYINRIQAQGGTNIFEAIGAALDTARKSGDGPARRPQVIVFLTDGRPTIGKTGMDEIVGLVKVEQVQLAPSGPDAKVEKPEKPAGERIRIFTFGVGDDVNAKLLDSVAQFSGGQPEYVRPGEDIEVKVSDFFAKASHPVMTDLKLAFGGEVKVTQMLPGHLPDLYFGQQVVAFARYSGSGDASVTLSGKVSAGKAALQEEKHTYEVALPKQSTDNDFIEPLWAHRKVGYLLDQIRLNGESKELKDEVIRLSKQYKIQTPYTSYLVLEEQHRKQYLGRELAEGDRRGLPDSRGPAAGDGSGPGWARMSRAGQAGGGLPADSIDRRAVAPARPAPTAVPPAPGVFAKPEAPAPAEAAPSLEITGRDRSGPAPEPAARPAGEKPEATPGTHGQQAWNMLADADQEKGRRLNEVMRQAEQKGKEAEKLSGANTYSGGRALSAGTSQFFLPSRPATQPAEQVGSALSLRGEIGGSAGLTNSGGGVLNLGDLKAESGAAAVNMAKDIAARKKALNLEGGQARQLDEGKKAAGRTFFAFRGFWVDEKFDPQARLTFVKWGSDAYFAIVSAHEELKDAFALGTNLIITTAEGKALVVCDSEGEEKMTDEQVKELFTAAPPATQPEAK